MGAAVTLVMLAQEANQDPQDQSVTVADKDSATLDQEDQRVT